MRSIGNFSLVIIFIDRLRRAFYQLFSTLLHECSIICSILNDQEGRIFKIFRNIFLNHYHIFDLMITQSFNDNQQRSLYISRLKSLDCFNIDGSSLKMMMTKMMMNSKWTHRQFCDVKVYKNYGTVQIWCPNILEPHTLKIFDGPHQCFKAVYLLRPQTFTFLLLIVSFDQTCTRVFPEIMAKKLIFVNFVNILP